MQRRLRITLAVAATAGALALGTGTALADSNDDGPFNISGHGYKQGDNSFDPSFRHGDNGGGGSSGFMSGMLGGG